MYKQTHMLLWLCVRVRIQVWCAITNKNKWYMRRQYQCDGVQYHGYATKTLRCFKVWAKRWGWGRVLHHSSSSKMSLILCTQQHKQRLHIQQAVAFNHQTFSRFGTISVDSNMILLWPVLGPTVTDFRHSSTLMRATSKVNLIHPNIYKWINQIIMIILISHINPQFHIVVGWTPIPIPIDWFLFPIFHHQNCQHRQPALSVGCPTICCASPASARRTLGNAQLTKCEDLRPIYHYIYIIIYILST